MIDLDRPETRMGIPIPEEGVQAGPEHHQLPGAHADGCRCVFGQPTAGADEPAHGPTLRTGRRTGAELTLGDTQNPDGQRIGESGPGLQ